MASKFFHVGFQSLSCGVASRMVFVDSQLPFCARMVPGVVILIRQEYFDRVGRIMQNHRKRANEVHKLCIYGRMNVPDMELNLRTSMFTSVVW